MEWWKIALIIVGIIPPVLALIFSVYACIRVGARSEKREGNDHET